MLIFTNNATQKQEPVFIDNYYTKSLDFHQKPSLLFFNFYKKREHAIIRLCVSSV